MAEEPEFYPPISNAMHVAKRLVGDVFSTEGNRNTVYWRGQWWLFNGTHWEQEENELEIKRPIWTRLGEVMLSKTKGPEPWSPTTASVSNLMEPLKIALMLKDKKTRHSGLSRDTPSTRMTLSFCKMVCSTSARVNSCRATTWSYLIPGRCLFPTMPQPHAPPLKSF